MSTPTTATSFASTEPLQYEECIDRIELLLGQFPWRQCEYPRLQLDFWGAEGRAILDIKLDAISRAYQDPCTEQGQQFLASVKAIPTAVEEAISESGNIVNGGLPDVWGSLARHFEVFLQLAAGLDQTKPAFSTIRDLVKWLAESPEDEYANSSSLANGTCQSPGIGSRYSRRSTSVLRWLADGARTTSARSAVFTSIV